MAENVNRDNYYVLSVENPESMLLFGMPRPTDKREDRWLKGNPFNNPLKQDPIVVTILAGNEHSDLMPYFGAEPVMSNDFYQSLVEAGVDNLDAYDCILRSEDGSVEYTGFKAVNIIGLIRATGEGTEFTGDSRLIDASMDQVSIDANKTHGALMFRLAENVSTVIVHERVKRYLEKKGFPSIVFRDPGMTLVL